MQKDILEITYLKSIAMNKSEYSSEIKTELLQIVEAFGLGSFVDLLTFEPSTTVDGYIFTQFETTIGRYNHYYRIKEL